MSNCTVIQTHDEIYIGSDSAISTIISNEIYRLSEDGEKLFVIDDMIIFCSGTLELSYDIIHEFNQTQNKDILSLQMIAKKLYEQSIKVNVETNLDILVGTMENNESALYQLSPYEDFIIKKNNVPKGYFAVLSGGIRTKESFELTYKNIEDGKIFKDVFQKTFDDISFEGIGGTLTVYKINKENIDLYYQSNIADKNIKYLNVNNLPKFLIVGEQIYGKLGVFAKIRSDQIVIDPDGTEKEFGDKLFDVEVEVQKYANDKDSQLRKDLRLENPLPSSMRLNNLGLHVDDQNGNNRVRLGQYATGKYGLLIRNKSGNATILDEDGIMQTWQEGRTDNVDSSNPLTLYVYIPPETRLIRKSILRFKLLPFRAYSRGTSSDGSYSTSTSSGGGIYTSTGSGGGEYTSTESGGYVNKTTGDSGVDVIYGTAQTDPSKGDADKYNHTHTYREVIGHKHYFEVPSHSHGVYLPSHSHSISISDHTHSVYIPPHSHGIDYGIYTSTTPYAVTIYINGYNRTYNLGGSFNTDQSNLDITSYLNIGQWNTIELGSSRLGRLDATVFVQAFIGM